MDCRAFAIWAELVNLPPSQPRGPRLPPDESKATATARPRRIHHISQSVAIRFWFLATVAIVSLVLDAVARTHPLQCSRYFSGSGRAMTY